MGNFFINTQAKEKLSLLYILPATKLQTETKTVNRACQKEEIYSNSKQKEC